MTALLFPVGHYLGPHFSAGAEEPVGFRVRLGPSLRWLGSEPELVAWSTAHGLGELADDEPMTRESLIANAQRLTDLDITAAVAGLVDRRLLVEVDPASSEATAGFAKGYRLRALMLALGRDPEEPDAVLLGVAGQPAVALSELGYAMWRSGQHTPTLWDACHAVAEADPAVTDPDTLLTELLGELHGLLGAGVAYLDAAEGEYVDAGVALH